MEIIRGLAKFIEVSNCSTDKAVRKFAGLYQNREAPYVDPSVYSAVKSVKRTQLYEWRKRFVEQGIAGLISRNGYALGANRVPMDQQTFILGTFKANPNLKAGRIAGLLRAKFTAPTTPRAVRNFLKQKREQDPALFEFIESSDSYKNKYQLALGSASEKAKHFLHYVEVDSTRADVLCADGKRHTIVGLVDIFSRKAKFLVTRTSNSWAIAGLLRGTIRDWGAPLNLVRDNGKDYDSIMVDEILQHTLGVNVIAVLPFTPEAKPHIERMFRTLSHMFFETLPGYVGHNVAERKKIESRKSFVERFMKKGQSLKVGLTPVELQEIIDRWVEGVYHNRNHSELNMSPNAKAASVEIGGRRIEDIRNLDILLAPAPKGSTRTIGKKGLRLGNQLYWADELIPWVGRKVLVRLDLRDAGRIFSFDPETKAFICEALDLSVSGISVGDLIAARKRANKRVRERVKAIHTLSVDPLEALEADIENARCERAIIGNPQLGEPMRDNPFVDAANAAANASFRTPEVRKDADTNREELSERFNMERESSLIRTAGSASHTGAMDANGLIFPFQEDQERPGFETARERFEYLRLKRRVASLGPMDPKWLRESVEDWFYYPDMFSESWPVSDKVCLTEIAPDHFPQYNELREGL